MVHAFLLIRSDSGSEKEVLETLEDYEEVKEADLIYGEWDIVIKLGMEGDISKLNDFILEKIRPLSGIKQTSTLIVAG